MRAARLRRRLRASQLLLDARRVPQPHGRAGTRQCPTAAPGLASAARPRRDSPTAAPGLDSAPRPRRDSTVPHGRAGTRPHLRRDSAVRHSGPRVRTRCLTSARRRWQVPRHGAARRRLEDHQHDRAHAATRRAFPAEYPVSTREAGGSLWLSACLRACASACACACGCVRACLSSACAWLAAPLEYPRSTPWSTPWSTLGAPPGVPRSTPGVPPEYPRRVPPRVPPGVLLRAVVGVLPADIRRRDGAVGRAALITPSTRITRSARTASTTV